MWSLVIAKDLFSVFKQEGLLNPAPARRYRRAILEAGGSKPAAELVRDFLGRAVRLHRLPAVARRRLTLKTIPWASHDVDELPDEETLRAFSKALLDDVAALESMLAAGRFETGVRRIGAEQEMFLVDDAMLPARGGAGAARAAPTTRG